MHKVTINLTPAAGSTKADFESAATEFLSELQSVGNLDVQIPKSADSGARGILALSGIIALGVEIGAFAAIYRLAKDAHEHRHNCEVEIEFENGVKITLRNLTELEAERAIFKYVTESDDSKESRD